MANPQDTERRLRLRPVFAPPGSDAGQVKCSWIDNRKVALANQRQMQKWKGRNDDQSSEGHSEGPQLRSDAFLLMCLLPLRRWLMSGLTWWRGERGFVRFLGHHMATLVGSSRLFMPVGAAWTKGKKTKQNKKTGQVHVARYEGGGGLRKATMGEA